MKKSGEIKVKDGFENFIDSLETKLTDESKIALMLLKSAVHNRRIESLSPVEQKALAGRCFELADEFISMSQNLSNIQDVIDEETKGE